MIKTSNIKIKVNRNSIVRDYDIYKIGQDLNGVDKEQRNNIRLIVSGLSDELAPALAVLYRYGGFLYAIFKKDSFSTEELESYIHNTLTTDSPGIHAIKLDINQQYSIYPNELCQLFCNMIPNMETYKQYNNISGRLYYFNDSSFKKDVVTAYNISIESLEKRKPNYVIQINAESYYKLSVVLKYHPNESDEIRSLPRYYVDEYDDVFKKVNGNINDDDCFVKRNPGSKKNGYIAKDIDIQDLSHFRNSKKGMFRQFLSDFNDYFQEYINIELIELSETTVLKKFKNIATDEIKIDSLNKLGINLIDTVNNTLSSMILDSLFEQLNQRGIQRVYKDHGGALNIILIHEPEYYSKNGLEDPHINDLLTQHIIYENCIDQDNMIGVNKNILDRVLHELLIKYDVYQQKISLYDWVCDDVVEFTTMDSEFNQKSKRYERIYYLAKVYPNSDLELHTISDKKSDTYKYYEKIFKDDHDKKFFYSVKPEMLITYRDIKLLIDDTSVMVLPDLNEIYFRLSNYNKTNELSQVELEDMLKSLKKKCPEYSDRIDSLIGYLNQDSYQYQEITNDQKGKDNPNSITPLIPLKDKLGKALVEFAREEYGIVLNPCLKSDVVKILQSIHILQDETNPNTCYYYVGKKDSMKFNLHTSCHLRSIMHLSGEKNEDILNMIFNMLRVDFVRNGEYTVLPFINKYINEFKKL